MNNYFITGKQQTGGQGVFDPFKKAANAVKDFFTKPQQTRVSYTRPTIPGYNYNPYQVKMGDTFEKIAEQNGMTVQQIQQANGNMTVPPPKGSYLNIPYNPANMVPGSRIQPYRAPGGGNSFTSGSNVNLVELQANITSQLQGGQLPGSIPFQVAKKLINPATGQPFTDNDYRADGYIYNNKTQTWEQPGVGANTPSVQSNANTGKPWEQIVSYNGKQVPAYVAELMNKRANERRQDAMEREARARARAAKKAPMATNAGGTPATSLDVQIGGG